MNKLYFSIIIPTLNEDKFLPTILCNLEKQRTKNFEVIVVDGNSSDETKNVVSKFSQTLPINFFQVQKRNVSHQRNYGAKSAKGKYLIFLDADSGVSSAFTKNLQNYIERKKGLVFIPFLIADENNPETKILFDLINFLIEVSQNINKPFSSGGSIIIERSFFNLIGGFDEKVFLAEDHDLIQKAWSWGVRARFLRNIKVRFNLRRMRKEGKIKLFYKYFLAAAHVLLKGKIDKKIFDYEMGGQFYRQIDKKKDLDEVLTDYFKQAKRYLKKLIEED